MCFQIISTRFILSFMTYCLPIQLSELWSFKKDFRFHITYCEPIKNRAFFFYNEGTLAFSHLLAATTAAIIIKIIITVIIIIAFIIIITHAVVIVNIIITIIAIVIIVTFTIINIVIV